jgi:hypothetical protein
MKKTQLGSRDLLTTGGGCPVEVSHKYFYRIYIFLKRSFVDCDHQKIIILINRQIIPHHVSKLQVQRNLFSIHLRTLKMDKSEK